MEGCAVSMTTMEERVDDAMRSDPPVSVTPRVTPFNQRAYRDALGNFGTGVTIITATGSEGPVGMTVNSFASVSLDPALVLWSLAKSSGRFAPFAEAQNYAIHVLCADQQDLASAFARNGNAFHACDWVLNGHGVPQIEGAIARFDCTRNAAHDAGDHLIIIGQVENFVHRQSEPLIFAKGSFGGFRRND